MPRRWRFCELGAGVFDRQRVLGDEHDVGAAGDAAHDGDPAGVAAHDLDDHHAVVRLRRRVQAVDRLGADRDGGVEAEGVVGAREVVVDRLRHADDRQPVLVVQARGDAERVLAADRDERVEPVRERARGRGSTPPSTLYGFVRLVPMIVPPRGRMPGDLARAERLGSWSSISPRQPSRTPITSCPRSSERRVTARITAFSPGQSPPPVRTPIRSGTRALCLRSPIRAAYTVGPAMQRPALAVLVLVALLAAAGCGGGSAKVAISKRSPTRETSCPQAWQAGGRGWPTGSRRPSTARPGCPSRSTRKIGGARFNGESVDPDRVLPRQLRLAGARSQRPRGARQPARLSGPDAVPICEDTLTVKGKTVREACPASAIRAGRRRIGSESPRPSTRPTREPISGTSSTPGTATGRCYTISEHVAPPYTYQQVVENLDRMMRGLVARSRPRVVGRCASPDASCSAASPPAGSARGDLRARRPAAAARRAGGRPDGAAAGAAPPRRACGWCATTTSRCSCRRSITRSSRRRSASTRSREPPRCSRATSRERFAELDAQLRADTGGARDHGRLGPAVLRRYVPGPRPRTTPDRPARDRDARAAVRVLETRSASRATPTTPILE